MSAEEDLTFIDVLKVVDSSIKLIAGLKLQNRGLLLSADWIPFAEKIEELETDCMKMKKLVMRKLRGKLCELLPAVSMEEDILDNILGHMNPQGEDAKMTLKFVETTEEEKAILTSICPYLEQICRILDQVSRCLEAINNCNCNNCNSLLQDRFYCKHMSTIGHLLKEILAKVNEGEDNIAVEDQGGEEIE